MQYTFTNDHAKQIYGGQLRAGSGGSAGLDLRAVEFQYNGRIGTGVKVAIPQGMVGLVVVRSSIGLVYGYCLANGTGVIDSDYRGEICARLAKMEPIGRFSEVVYHTNENEIINCQAYKLHNVKMPSLSLAQGERFAQLIVLPCSNIATYVASLDDTDRGEGGFGSTGRL